MNFSIFIPAYKHTFLDKAIHSCLNQTYDDFELVILNDASPEDLDSVIAQFCDKRLHYYKNDKNVGAINVVDNWNKCLDLCHGDYVICMGDDDCLASTCLEKYVEIINKYPRLGVYHTRTIIIDEIGEAINIQASRPAYESDLSLAWHRWNGRFVQFIGDFCFDLKLLKENKGFYKLPLAWGSDDISAIIAAHKAGIANTQDVGFYYRINSQTITNTPNTEFKLQAIAKEKEWYESFLNCIPQKKDDLLYHDLLLRDLPSHFRRKILNTISKELRTNHSIKNYIKWYFNKNKYGVSFKEYIFILIKSFNR